MLLVLIIIGSYKFYNYGKFNNEINSIENNIKQIIDYDDPSICFIIEGVNPTVLTNITDEYTTEAKLENVLKDLNFIK